ncbi:MAG: orotate phosphoribosyltransferase [Pseudomonadota bacterium]
MATKKKAKSPATGSSKKPAKTLNGKDKSGRTPAATEARETARLLLDIEAIHCRPENPYIFTSGRASPVYIDCRKLISFPEARSKIMGYAHKMIERDIGWNKVDVVAGGETAGIPFAAFLAALAKKPMIYVRKQPKGFGRMAQIEGDLKPGKRVLLVEDLATDGGSKLVFIEALKKAEAKVTDCFVIFHYGIFPQSVEMLAAADVRLHALATWWDALEAAEKHKYFDERGLTETRAFLEAPEQWSASHGGRPPARLPLGR